MRMRVICRDCGGENVLRDAWVRWEAGGQCWEVDVTLDAAFCHDCDGEVALDQRPELVS